MRAPALFGLLLIGFSAALLTGIQPPQTAGFEHLIPGDVVGLLVLRTPPANLDFLEHSRLPEQFQLDPAQLRRQLDDRVPPELARLLNEDLSEAWLCLHRLTPRKGGSWRIHFSAILVPRPLHMELLRLRLELAVLQAFGKGTLASERDNLRVYRGARPGQVLYQLFMPGFLLVSNSEEGWPEIVRTVAGRRTSLLQNATFLKIRSRLPRREGLFVYLDGSRIFTLLPTFGYSISWQDQSYRDRYYEIR